MIDSPAFEGIYGGTIYPSPSELLRLSADSEAVIDLSSSMPYVTSHPDGINGGWKGCKPLLDQCL